MLIHDCFEMKNKVIEVAAAVLRAADGSFLLAQRPVGKPMAGFWEFPGGKLEAGETARQALIRELQEELGIVAETLFPWLTQTFTYPHASVRLHFFRVTAWQGEIRSLEEQAFSWQQPNSTCVQPILPANKPILQALQLPDLYALSNVAALGIETFLARLARRLRQGVRLIQLREKSLDAVTFRALAEQVLRLAHSAGAHVLFNENIALAQELGADGVQLTSTQLLTMTQRPALKFCGASCHNRVELRRAEQLGCDFALLSPVLPTRSHPGAAHLGWETFAAVAAGATIPVFALGGLTREDFDCAWQHGAHGIALLSQAW